MIVTTWEDTLREYEVDNLGWFKIVKLANSSKVVPLGGCDCNEESDHFAWDKFMDRACIDDKHCNAG